MTALFSPLTPISATVHPAAVVVTVAFIVFLPLTPSADVVTGWSSPSTTVAHEQVTQVAVQCRNKPSRARSNPVFSLSLFSSNSSTL